MHQNGKPRREGRENNSSGLKDIKWERRCKKFAEVGKWETNQRPSAGSLKREKRDKISNCNQRRDIRYSGASVEVDRVERRNHWRS